MVGGDVVCGVGWTGVSVGYFLTFAFFPLFIESEV